MSQEDFARIGNYARMLLPDENIDRHKCTRTVPMEVLCPGLSRTGTLTMQKALSILGYPNPYHFSSLYGNIKDCDMWLEAFNAVFHGHGSFGRQQWDQLLGHCGAITDNPGCVFINELMDAYPDAKVILVERDVDKWHKSFSAFMDAIFSPLNIWIMPNLDPAWHGRITSVGSNWLKAQFGTNSSKDKVLKNARQGYKDHYARVRRLAKEKNIALLEYELGTGWGPLCEYLGKPIPRDENGLEIDFPRLNETNSIQQVISVMVSRSMGAAARNVGMVLGGTMVALLGIWWALNRNGD